MPKPKKYTPLLWIGNKRFEYEKSFDKEKQAIAFADKKAKEIMKLDLETKKKIFGKVKTLKTGFNVQ